MNLQATGAGGVLSQNHPMRMPDVAVRPTIGGIVEVGVEGDGQSHDTLAAIEADVATVERRRPDIGIDARSLEPTGGIRLVDTGFAAHPGGENGIVALGDDAGLDD